MVSCKECLMNDSITEFKIVKEGLCNFCIDWKNNKKKIGNFTDEQISANLLSLKETILKNPNKSGYDCVVGLSGGTDSSYVVYQLWKLKLNPLIIHMDNGWNSKISNQNINKILEKTKFDYKTLILNWEEFKDLQRAFLYAGVPDIELLTDHAIFSYILNFAIKNNIKFIISGVNYATEHSVVPSWGWRKDDFSHIKKIHKKYGKLKIKSFPKMYPFKKFFYEKILKKITYIDLLDYLNYNSHEAKKILKDEFDWNDYGGKHHESFFTKFFQGYILPKKFNIDKRILHYSCLIRNKEISKEDAIGMIKLPFLETQKIDEYKNFFLKKLNLSHEEFDSIMSENPKRHSDYDINLYDNFIFRLAKKSVKKFLK
tara:strand:+ start:1025 stop:2137 length:1113 start_codon:yes stop_codon:yes gene_type:complete